MEAFKAASLLADACFLYKALFAFCNQRNVFLQVDCLEETLEKSFQAKGSSDLRVSILLDYTRGSRGRCYDAFFLQRLSVQLGCVDCFFRESLS